MIPAPWERNGRRFGRSWAAAAREPNGLASGVMKAALAAPGEFASPHADHGAIFGQTVLHRGALAAASP